MKKLIVNAFLLCLTLSNTYSQTDSVLIKKLYEPILTCEIVATNSQKLLPTFSLYELAGINQILSVWESNCSNTEPIQRLRILMAVFHGGLSDSLYNDYVDNHLSGFRSRLRAGKSDNRGYTYEYNKVWLDYVPPGGEYDKWTQRIAIDLLGSRSLSKSEYLLCLLLSGNDVLFEKEIYSEEYKETSLSKKLRQRAYDYWNYGMIFKISTGVWIPMGQLSCNFQPSPLLTFAFTLPIQKSTRLDLGIQLAILLQAKPFLIQVDNLEYTVHAKTSGNVGAWLTREFGVGEKSHLDIMGGIGVGLMDTDLKKPQQNPDGTDNYYAITTIDLSFGASIRTRVFKKRSMGLNVSYHFAPYALDKKLVKDFGNQYLTTGLVYRF
jgi:hypothetical protein